MLQEEFFGYESINNLTRNLKKENSKNIFLVTGKKSFETCGAKQTLDRLLKDYEVTRFNQFSPNPKLQDIQKGLEEFRKKDSDIIVAVGGGSTIDVAKAIKMFYFNETKKRVPLVAVPTTAGTGSEATHFLVYYIGKDKQSAGNSDLVLPNYSICDPELTLSLPKYVAASTGMDALSQAIESYWNINSTLESQEFARQAIRLLIENLEEAVDFNKKQARENVMKAANLSGKAINLTKTTACHAVAYPMTSYFNIFHGHAAALTLGEILVYNNNVNKEDCLDKRGVGYVKENIGGLIGLIGTNNCDEARSRIQKLMNNLELETKLSGLGLKKEDLDIIIEKGFNPQRVKNNPRRLDKKEIRKILRNIY
tara:strand:+ start:73 stop:1173 length:1101 start_codon:yes stop_codon:yes gene_type:complete